MKEDAGIAGIKYRVPLDKLQIGNQTTGGLSPSLGEPHVTLIICARLSVSAQLHFKLKADIAMQPYLYLHPSPCQAHFFFFFFFFFFFLLLTPRNTQQAQDHIANTHTGS
eukprot:1159585-Pelagomonas_calceolata.AAC.3